MSKKIYLIRHGQTDYNKKGIVQGNKVDSDLNAVGKQQASLFFDAYKHIPFDKIYTSKLKRTHQSVQAFIEAGIPSESFEGLNEISWGDMDGVQASYHDTEAYKDIVKRWSAGEVDTSLHNGESPLQVWKRQEPVLKKLLFEEPGKTFLVCMHGRAIRVLLAGLVLKDLSTMESFMHDNLSLYILNFDGENSHIELSNDTSHLQSLR
ncbi:MAG: histidine phosphatase family protein [Cytophagaceae bacterium]|nr:histidine phosphatase family protein [Cytophagaceae bacterium]